MAASNGEALPFLVPEVGESEESVVPSEMVQPVPFCPVGPPALEPSESQETLDVAVAATQPGDVLTPGDSSAELAVASEANADGQAAESGNGKSAEDEEKRGEDQNGLETNTQLVPKPREADNTMLALDEAQSDVEDYFVPCPKCGRHVNITDTVVRSQTERWCKCCNSLMTLLRRNLAWPPVEFTALTASEQQEFFKDAALSKSQHQQFKYGRVRDLLVTCLVKRSTSQKIHQVGGTYLPLSVYVARGYDLPPAFAETAPKQWSEPLGCWTFLLPELTISHKEIQETVNEKILQAERSMKKRKAVEQADNGSDKAAKVGDASSAQEDTMVLDLCTESEEEDGTVVPSGGSKAAKGSKQLAAAAKKAAKKKEKEELAAAKKKEAAAKKAAATANRKTAALATRTVNQLNQAIKTAHAFLKDSQGKIPLQPEDPQIVELVKSVGTLEEWKKAASVALTTAAKCSGVALDPLPYDNDKAVSALIKSVQGSISALKVLLKPPRRGTGATKAN